MLNFEYDPRKAASNLRKHGVSFEEASSVFENDPFAYTDYNWQHSEADVRFFTIGLSNRGKLLYIVHNELEDGIVRLISARRSTAHERSLYEEG